MNLLKYGVETASFCTLFEFVMSIINRLGLRVKGNDPSIWEILKAIIYCSPAALTYVYVTVSALNSSDKVIIGSSLMTLSGGLVNITAKIFTLLFGGKRVKQLIKIVVNSTNDNAMKHADQVQNGLLKKYVTIAKIVTNIEMCSFVVTVSLVYVVPYFISIATSRWIIPANLQIIGVSGTSHPGYELHIVMTIYMVVYNMTLIAASDLLFFYLTLYIAYQFDVCKHLVSTLGQARDGQQAAGKLLRRVAVLHSKICRFCKMCSRTFKWIFVFEVASISLCLSVSLTMHHVNPLLYTMAIQIITVQFWIFCLFAELVNTKSQETSRAIYLSEWNNLQSIADRKIFVMLLQNSQASMSFSPFGLIRLSLETFVKVIRAAFSYYTFLKSVI